MKKWSVVTLSLLLSVVGCAPEPPQPQFTAEDEVAIRALFDQFGTNWVEGQSRANLDLYSDDAAELLVNIREGKDAIRERWEGFIDRYEFTRANLEVREIIGWGEYAYASVSAESHFLYDGDPMIQNATWMTLLRRGAEGAWTIYRVTWQAASRADTTGT